MQIKNSASVGSDYRVNTKTTHFEKRILNGLQSRKIVSVVTYTTHGHEIAWRA